MACFGVNPDVIAIYIQMSRKCTPNRKDVELLATLETASISLCGIAMLLWMSIGTFTRAEWGEAFAQRTIFVLCVTACVLVDGMSHQALADGCQGQSCQTYRREI